MLKKKILNLFRSQKRSPYRLLKNSRLESHNSCSLCIDKIFNKNVIKDAIKLVTYGKTSVMNLQ